ncbi:hypothetical protein MHPYR_470043 [uncultured Mycobacterium sp.]|uniref:JAB domain-containing protein n=1 Tax=uncultured Mycobacterium sp. TaxID=171292 RepID=A0A1Y5PK56_9MYCO|nr:hypothetical protein MHPYR_470043 [uncultured Mycobacterium sp.]
MYSVRIGADLAEPLHEYLAAPIERMAFLLSQVSSEPDDNNTTSWTARDILYLSDEADYAYQDDEGMELADHVRPKILQAATKAGAALIEVHSHGSTAWPAAFSRTDLVGLREVAPQMLWRLPRRPYTAIVLHDQDVDALVWTARNTPPIVPDTIGLGDRRLRPTGRSAERLSREAI